MTVNPVQAFRDVLVAITENKLAFLMLCGALWLAADTPGGVEIADLAQIFGAQLQETTP